MIFCFHGISNTNENMLHSFGNVVICLRESSGNVFKGVCPNPVDRGVRVKEIPRTFVRSGSAS